MLLIEAVRGCDDLDLVVALVLVPHPGYIDDLVVAENVDSPFVGIESGVPVVDVVLSVPMFVVLAFVVVFVGLKDGFDVGGEEVELILGVTLDGEVFAAVLAEVARAGRRGDRPSS